MEHCHCKRQSRHPTFTINLERKNESIYKEKWSDYISSCAISYMDSSKTQLNEMLLHERWNSYMFRIQCHHAPEMLAKEPTQATRKACISRKLAYFSN